jgi:predicted nucleic acid-binding protein
MSGADPFFVDTNLLVYALDPQAADKHMTAQRWLHGLWTAGAGRLSWQVLNELYAVTTRKTAVPVQDIRASVLSLSAWQPADMSLAMLKRAWYWGDTAGVPWWDGMIVAAAELSGSRWLLSEDFQNDRIFESVTVVNPFRASPAEFGLAAPE